MELDKGCPLFNFCNCKTAVCMVLQPDETCYWYKYFKKLIENKNRADDN